MNTIEKLKDLEEYRLQLRNGLRTPGGADHTIRMCQAIIANGTFKNRVEWTAILKEKGIYNNPDYLCTL